VAGAITRPFRVANQPRLDVGLECGLLGQRRAIDRSPVTGDPGIELQDRLAAHCPPHRYRDAQKLHFPRTDCDGKVWRHGASVWFPKRCEAQGALGVPRVLHGELEEERLSRPNPSRRRLEDELHTFQFPGGTLTEADRQDIRISRVDALGANQVDDARDHDRQRQRSCR
jgi:hypothetical protein